MTWARCRKRHGSRCTGFERSAVGAKAVAVLRAGRGGRDVHGWECKNLPKAKREELTGRGAVGKTVVVGAEDRQTKSVTARTVESANRGRPCTASSIDMQRLA